MKNTILSIALILACGSINAQIPKIDWVKSMGTTDQRIYAKSIATDKLGNSYTIGTFEGLCDMDPSSSTLYLNSSGTNDIFISKFDLKGNLVWAKQISGNANSESPTGIRVDDAGNCYITGFLVGTMDFDPGTKVNNLSSLGEEDVFLLKLNTDGDFIWVKQIGSNSFETISDIQIDQTGNIYLLGSFATTLDADPSSIAVNNLSASQGNTFILKFDNSGQLIWAKNFGSSTTKANGLGLDKKNNVYCVGYFSDYADFDPSPKVYNITAMGKSIDCDDDAFVLKLDNLGSFLWAKNFGGKNKTYAFDITIDKENSLYISGNFDNTCDFDPNAGVYNLKSSGNNDGFITKWDSTGNFYWAQKIGGASYGDLVNQTAADQDNNIYILGMFNGMVDFGLGSKYYPLTSKATQDSYILKMDKSGKFIDAQSFYGYSTAFNLQNNGDFYVNGYYSGSGDFDPDPSASQTMSSKGIIDAFVLKLGSNALGISNDKKSAEVFAVYPNPGHSIFEIHSSGTDGFQNIRVYNLNGSVIEQQDKLHGSAAINLSSYPVGLYFIECFKVGSSIGIQKIIRE
ncbi:MAG: SBBP repeat-containing protein [Bacteroidota bacterium]